MIGLIARFIEGFDSALERHKILAVLAFSTLFLVISSLISATKLLWYDEMATYYPAKLPTVGGVIDFFQKGIDVHTPVASLVERLSISVFGDGPVMDRMPFTLGYLVFSICIFVFVVRRCPAVYALPAMILPSLTLMSYYATELRCYGLVLGLTGLAMVSWQAAAGTPRRSLAVAGLWLSLAGAICCHYYAAFLLIPFCLAELTRTWVNRRIDWPVWIALLSVPLVILIFLPAIHAAQVAYTGGMLAVRPSSLGQIQSSYLFLLSISNVPILGCALLCLLLVPQFFQPQPKRIKHISAAEWVLALTLSMLPFFVVPAALFIGAFYARYVLPCVAGVAIVLMFALCRALKGDRMVGTVITLFFLAWFVNKSAGEIRNQESENGGLKVPLGEPLRQSAWMRKVEQSNLPVAVVPATMFLQTQHYVKPSVRDRVFYLADPANASVYGDVPSSDTNMLLFSKVLPLRVARFKEFVATHPRFFVSIDPTQQGWLPVALVDLGADVRLVARSYPILLYEVTMGAGTSTR